MGRKKAKASKAKHKQTGHKPSTGGNEPSGSKPSAPKSSGQKPIDPTAEPFEKTIEEKKQEVAEKFSKLLLSTMEVLNYNEKSYISAEVLMLIYFVRCISFISISTKLIIIS